MKSYLSLFLAVGMGMAALTTTHAETIFGVTDTGSLRSFDSLTPGTQSTIGAVSGLNAGHTLRGIDFRPNGGALYGISTDSTGGTAQGRRLARHER